MGGLRLDSQEAVFKGGTRGPAVVAGDLNAGTLLKAIRYDGPVKMPPAAKLSDAEAAVLFEWVKMGAPWGQAQPVTSNVTSAKFWAFQPLSNRPIPVVKHQNWPKNPIDNFILAELEKKGIAPAAPASRRTLIRRVTLDLTGLPPTPEEVRDFLADESSQAYSKLIDRLLSSARYGEHWGRHWLDVARYADSNGLDENLVYRNAWRYRDYVIKAFNSDKPYNVFVQEQLAGDLLPSSNDAEAFERWTATGFLSLGAKMLAEDDPVKMEMDIVDEQVDTTTRAFLGLTVGCARCHDHKFDPIPTADYYSLAGIFRSTKTMENFKVVAKWHEHVLAPAPDREKLQKHLDRIEAKKAELDAVTKPANKILQESALHQTAAYLNAAQELMRRRQIQLPHADGSKAILFDHTFESDKDFEFQAPQAGMYQLDLHYASAESRPVDLYINGELIKSKAIGAATGTATPDTWSVEGVFLLKSGANQIRLKRGGKLNAVDKFTILAVDLPDEQLPKSAEQFARIANLNPEFLDQWTAYLKRTKEDQSSILQDWHKNPSSELAAKYQQWFEESVNAAAPDERQKQFLEVFRDKFGPFAVPPQPSRFYAKEQADLFARLDKERLALEKETPVYPQAMGVREGKVEDLRIHIRGSHLTLGDPAPRRFLRIISGENQKPLDASQSGRLELARWLTEPTNPLPSRVMANRIWRGHFGVGIVPSVDNFGRLGDLPTNQPLLDWLAARFVESGWSIKAMHRLILLSSTYQMSTAFDEKAYAVDPENKLLWRMNRHRLEAESIRDSIFASAGMLDFSMGGSMLKFKDREYVTSTENRDTTDYDATRRSIYLPVVRSSLYDVFQAFDFGDPSVINGDRPTTTVAPQALFMMNSSVVAKATRHLAEVLMKQSTDPNERVQLAYQRILGRPATAHELERAAEFLKQAQSVAPPPDSDLTALRSFCRALIASNEFVYVE